MPQPLPPLNALRAFESAGRLQSFTRAARELHVTTAAISHQIKGLEKYLGVRLFRRTPRRLTLTDAGAAAWARIHEGFEQLRLGADTLRSHRRGGALTLGVTPAFATRWLLPRLPAFRAAHPQVALRIVAGVAPVDFEHGDTDAAIRFGRGVHDGVDAQPLFGECLAPLVAPARHRDFPLRRLSDLRQAPLIHDDSMRRAGRMIGWEQCLHDAGLGDVDAGRGLRFDDSHLALQAAALGGGVALGRLAYAAGDLEAGRLVAPLPLRLPLDAGYHLLVPRGRLASPALMAFAGWVVEEAQVFQQALARFAA
ncbi:MAG: transcriptional regulator GcvA [Steroidobacteraceae bacterium]|jgi:LysR family glycine cleavage system transcriptional activator|nr:transcriptional regulator GcvA [Steroidobacteraceae bacterium]